MAMQTQMGDAKFCLIIFSTLLCLTNCTKSDDVQEDSTEEYEEIKVMTYNILYSTSNDQTLKTIRETNADIIGLQEASQARIIELAQNLHYKFYLIPESSGNFGANDTGILSRFPITRFLKDGVVVQVNPELEVAIFTVHLSPYPYEPYDFRDGVITTPQQAITSASETRLPEINPVLEQIQEIKTENIPVFLTGDFNEPSHLDWTETTASHNMHFNQVVEWPVSKAIAAVDLKDAYRMKFENAANFPGNTWTTFESDDEVYDRIDIIYHSEETKLSLFDVRLVGGTTNTAGIKVDGYASDHYAVMATYKLN